MVTVKVYNQEGKEIENLGLNEAVFGLPWNADLVSQALRVFLANKRQVLASTKDRAQVRGGGRKPWRQKGTGRARHGSIRSPLWRHGGVTFGPTKERNFKLKINKKMTLKAFLTALSAKAKDNEILVFNELKLAAPKTKEAAKIMANFPKVKNGLLLVKDENLKMAFRNLPNVTVSNINNLNILDVLRYQYLIFTKDGVERLNKNYIK